MRRIVWELLSESAGFDVGRLYSGVRGRNALYTGVTQDVDARLARHTAGNGARYTRGRGPFKVVYTEKTSAKGAALRRERQIKGMRKGEKLALIEAGRGGS